MPRKPGTSGSEGGRRKRTRSPGTSSAAYPTSCPRSIGAAGRAEASANAEPAAYLTTVPGVARHRQGVHLPIADLHPGGRGGGVQPGADGQPGAGGGRGDAVDDDLVAGQWPAAPVGGDVGKQPVLDLVPLGGPRREVAHRDRQSGLGGQRRQLGLPRTGPIAVGAARVGGDQQPGGVRVLLAATAPPPTADRFHRKSRRVVIGADTYPACVGGQVIDPVRNRLPDLGIGEIVGGHRDRFALPTPLTSGILVRADQLLFLGLLPYPWVRLCASG